MSLTPSRLLRVARPVLLAALVVACVVALVASWGDVADALPRVGVVRLGVATVAAIVAGVLLAVGWRILLVDIAEQDVALGEAVAAYSAAQLGKYVPGSVWPVVVQLALTRRHGIARRAVVSAFVVQVVILVVAAVASAAVTLPWVDAEQLRTRWWLLLVAPAMGVMLVPRVQRAVLDRAGRLLGRDLHVPMPSMATNGRAAVVSVLVYVAYGLHLAVLAQPLSTRPTISVVLQSIGGFALAWAAGLLVIFAPAGLGVRELVLTLTMGAVVLGDDATALAVLSRVSVALADLVLGVGGLALLAALGISTGRARRELAAERAGTAPEVDRPGAGSG